LGLNIADKDWMLDVISTLSNGRHHFFRKDFVAPKRNKDVQEIYIDNDDGFFTGLPQTKSKSKSNSGSMMVMSKLQQEQLKL